MSFGWNWGRGVEKTLHTCPFEQIMAHTSPPSNAHGSAILRGGGGLRGGIISPWGISHAILNLLWEISHPHAVSRPLVGAGCGRDCCQLFSIPAKNVASCRQSSQVYLAYSNEKRTITRSSIIDSDGNISLFQLLWKGTTDKTFC